MEKFTLIAANGERCGRIRDLYFDDLRWHVSHLVVTLDPRLRGPKQVLLAPAALESFRDQDETLVWKGSPDALAQAPSAQSVLTVCQQYASMALSSPGGSFRAPRLTGANPHLRSARAVMQYRLQFLGEFAGTLADLILDPSLSEVRYLAVEQTIDRRTVQFHIHSSAVERFTWTTQRVLLKFLEPVELDHGAAPFLPIPAFAAA